MHSLISNDHRDEVFLIEGRTVVAVLKRRKHKMEFKDCQSEQKGLAFVEKD